jgi:hypothetical protein
VVVVFAAIGYVATAYFARATFTVVPKVVSVEVNSIFPISQRDSSASSTILYAPLVLEDTATTSVPSTVGPVLNTKAQGPVIIYNTFSDKPQKIIAGTRFANASTKVYRLASSVVVPGYTLSSKKVIVPGSVKAVLVADQAGDKYNITDSSSISDFKVLSYKDTTKYDSIYARLTGTFSGGFSGSQSIISPSVMTSAVSSLQANLVDSLTKQAQTLVPSGFVFYKTAYKASFSAPTIKKETSTTSSVSIKGSINFFALQEKDLIASLAGSNTLQIFGKSTYRDSGLDSLEVQPIFSTSTVSLKIKGSFDLIGSLSVDEFKKIVMGKTSDETKDALKIYQPVVETISGEVMPPWARIPNDPGRISVIIDQRK